VARIFITGSADGLGQMSASLLIGQGHEVVLHARSEERGREAISKTPGAVAVFTGDLLNIDQTKELAEKVNKSGVFDAIIHNAGVYQTSPDQIFAVNTLAPYVLTSLIHKPKRLIYLSSGMHLSGRPNIRYLRTDINRITYSDSKLHVVLLALAVARKWPEIYAIAVDPGWVPTKMGGKNAPDNLQKGIETQVWLAVSDDKKATVSGRYFHHQKERPYNKIAGDETTQEELLRELAIISGVAFPD
jgi:NAD(P)-dependent dehydrogenase (short-subunit alcohol dehydrogenase family)